VLAVEPQRAPVEAGLLHQIELDRGDDAQRALAAAQPEEQVGVLGGGRPAKFAVAGDDLDRPDPVGGQAVGAGHRAETAAGGVADDADVGDGAGQRRQAVRRGRLDNAQPLDAGADPGPALGVDDAFVEAGGADQQLADQRGDGAACRIRHICARTTSSQSVVGGGGRRPLGCGVRPASPGMLCVAHQQDRVGQRQLRTTVRGRVAPQPPAEPAVQSR